MSTTLNSTILSVTRRTSKGFTVGEIYDRVLARQSASARLSTETNWPYNSVRARVYELARAGELATKTARKDAVSGRKSMTFARNS